MVSTSWERKGRGLQALENNPSKNNARLKVMMSKKHNTVASHRCLEYRKHSERHALGRRLNEGSSCPRWPAEVESSTLTLHDTHSRESTHVREPGSADASCSSRRRSNNNTQMINQHGRNLGDNLASGKPFKPRHHPLDNSNSGKTLTQKKPKKNPKQQQI